LGIARFTLDGITAGFAQSDASVRQRKNRAKPIVVQRPDFGHLIFNVAKLQEDFLQRLKLL
jgi:hypothetical protein